MTPDRSVWTTRFGTLAGGSLGLLFAFGAAILAESSQRDPVWVLRIGSAVGMLAGGAAGRHLASRGGERLYVPLGLAAGLSLSGVVAVLILGLAGVSR